MAARGIVRSVELAEIDSSNWRDVCALRVQPSQTEFVAPVSYYLALCTYGDDWTPLAVVDGAAGDVVGFVMWAVDDEDDSFWIGGLVVDADRQRQGYGAATIEALLELARDQGLRAAALSYQSSNPGRALYRGLGFDETGEVEDDEIVARRSLSPR